MNDAETSSLQRFGGTLAERFYFGQIITDIVRYQLFSISIASKKDGVLALIKQLLYIHTFKQRPSIVKVRISQCRQEVLSLVK